MSGSFGNYQVLYAPNAPAEDIRLGQLFVDESEAAPLDMLKICTSLGPPVYTSITDGIVALMPVPANPTGTVGLTAVNGVLTTYMRSDAAPPLSQSIAPTWTGNHLFNGSTLGGSAIATWTGTHDFQAQARFQSAAQGGSASNPSIRFSGDADSGFYPFSTANVLAVALGGVPQILFDGGGIPVKITGTSDATQPSCRYSQYTTDFNTERGYWGFPTSLSDLMILRNITGSIELRTSSNNSSVTAEPNGVEIPKAERLTGVITPAQLTANTDNWNPTGLSTARVIRVSTDASRNLTGIVAQAAGTRLTLINVGTTDLVLIDNLTSTAANRFELTANMTVSANESVELFYDTTSSRWRVIAACLSAVT